MKILGITYSFANPSAALTVNGQVIAYAEEERFLRNKNAKGKFPNYAIDYVLKEAGITIEEVDIIAQADDCGKYDNGHIERHFKSINKKYPTCSADIAYQKNRVNNFRSQRQKQIIQQNILKQYGEIRLPDIRFVPHHLSHALTAFFNSGFEESLVLSIDGSGEDITTAWWIGKKNKLELLHEIKIPHSLGWFYSAFTEYLGFEAYDGEYKVMGLAAYGKPNKQIAEKIEKIAWYDNKGGFMTDPMLLSRGIRSHSFYYPDALYDYLGKPPRGEKEPIEDWHKDCAFAVQKRLEEIVLEMTKYWINRTNLKKLCISGGVGLNVKMNGRIFSAGIVDDIYIFPLCLDAGLAIGSAMALLYENGNLKKDFLRDVFLGPSYNDDTICEILKQCKVQFTSHENIEKKTARLLSKGFVVGWFQGRMEGGPRALGARSILADPRMVESKDKVNQVIKYRELWRPFCPSMTEEAAKKYFIKYTAAPFMIITFDANEKAKREIPAVVHIDQTSRPQIVSPESNQRFHRLLTEFKKLTGTPVLLNTSFNVKGEPIVCTPLDALRTFFATGMDALVLGKYLVVKPKTFGAK